MARYRQLFALVFGSFVCVGCDRSEELSPAPSSAIDAELESLRFSEGRRWVEHAESLAEGKQPDFFAAAMAAGRAIGYEGFGRGDAVGVDPEFAERFPILVSADKHPAYAEWVRREIDRYLTRVRLPIWSSPSFRHHSSEIGDISFSPDGKLIRSLDWGGNLRLWDAKGGELIEEVEVEYPGEWEIVAISPDGGRLALSLNDSTVEGQVIVWDVEKRELVAGPVRGPGDHVYGVNFSPDGETIVIVGNESRLFDVLDLQTLESPAVELALTGSVDDWDGVEFSPDGRYLIGYDDGGSHSIWDAKTWEALETTFPTTEEVVCFSQDGSVLAVGKKGGGVTLLTVPEGEVLDGEFACESRLSSLCFSPDDQILAGGCVDGTIVFWYAWGEQIGEPMSGHPDPVRSLAFSPDGKRLVSGSDAICVWDVRTRERVDDQNFDSRIGNSTARLWRKSARVLFSPDGEQLISWGDDQPLRAWVVGSGKSVGTGLNNRRIGRVIQATYCPDGRLLVIASKDGGLCLWDGRACRPISKSVAGDLGRSERVVFNEDRSRVAFVLDGTRVHLMDTVTGELLGAPMPAHPHGVERLQFSPDGKHLASYRLQVFLWDAETGELLKKFDRNERFDWWGGPQPGSQNSYLSPGSVRRIANSPDQRTQARCDGKKIIFQDAVTQHPIGDPLLTHPGPVASIEFSPDAMNIAGVDQYSNLRLWNTQPVMSAGRRALEKGQSPSAFSPDGSMLAVLTREGIGFIDLASGQMSGLTISGKPWGGVNRVAFHPTGERLAASMADGGIRFFDVATGTQVGVELSGQLKRCWRLQFSPDGKYLASSSFDRALRIWEVESGKLLATPQEPDDSFSAEILTWLTFSDDGSYLAAGSKQRLLVWNIAAGKEVDCGVAPFYSKAGNFDPDHKTLRVVGVGEIRSWGASTGEPVNRLVKGRWNSWSIAFCSDGEHFVAADNDGDLWRWNVATGETDGAAIGRGGHAQLLLSSDGKTLALETQRSAWLQSVVEQRSEVDLAVYLAEGRYAFHGRNLIYSASISDHLFKRRWYSPVNRSGAVLTDYSWDQLEQRLELLMAAGNWDEAMREFQGARNGRGREAVDGCRLKFVRAALIRVSKIKKPARAEVWFEKVIALIDDELLNSGGLDQALFALAISGVAEDRVSALLEERGSQPLMEARSKR